MAIHHRSLNKVTVFNAEKDVHKFYGANISMELVVSRVL